MLPTHHGEVIDGCLILFPAPPHDHLRIASNLEDVLSQAVPATAMVLTDTPVRLPGGDGPIPDLVVTTVPEGCLDRELPVEYVHTVVEVVAPASRHWDRVRKPELYAEAGIPCYWRVEPEPWRAYRGEVPVIVVRIRADGRWQLLLAPAGRTHELPVAVGRGPGGTPVTSTVAIDPARLIDRRTHGLE
jgi:Uma2 family endonuclease